MKKNNSLLLSILRGAVCCFVLLGMAFIFTNNTKNMKGNSNSLSNEEFSLGDTIDHCAEDASGQSCRYRWRTDGEQQIGEYTTEPTSCQGTTPSPDGGLSYYYSECHKNGVGSYGTIEDGPWIWVGTLHTRVQSCTETCSRCEPGYTLSGNECPACDSGNYCDGEMMYECEPGTYQELQGQSSCKRCTGQTYQDGYAKTSCKICNGVVNSDHTTCTPCEGDNTYVANNQCVTCNAGYKATDTYPQCHLVIEKGKYLVSGSTTTQNCPEGTYSDVIGTYGQDGTCINGTCIVGESSCKKCDEGLTSPAGSTSAGQCVNAEATIAIVGGGVTAYVTPSVCKTYTLTLKGSNNQELTSGDLTELGGGSSVVTWEVSGDDGHNCAGTTCTVKVCGKGCNSNPDVKVKATIGSSSASTEIHRYKYREWTSKTWNKEAAGTAYIYDGSALDNPTCVAYSEPYTEGGVTKYKKQWNRCCNSGGTGPTTSYKCYEDENGGYHWSTTSEPSWVVVTKTEPECKDSDACFEKPDGTRTWGKYYAQISEGYKLITSIGDRDTCEAQSEEEACYVNNDDGTIDYKWSATALEGYTVLYTKDEGDASDCQPELCYINVQTGAYDFGKHEGDGTYTKVYDENGLLIRSASMCVAPGEDACYEGPNGYEWGAFDGDPDYTLVPEITKLSDCINGKGEVPVPPTGISISKVIYIFMAILMACGVGFIYYSSVVKKEVVKEEK